MHMVPASMEAEPATPGFVPRSDQYAALHQNFRDTHTLEAERQRAEKLRTLGGWALAGVFGMFALVAEMQNINRPLPKDRFEIAFLHDDGSYSAPVEMKDLAPVQQREVLQTALVNYITYRAGYSYAASQKAYNIVSVMTAGQEQNRYQRVMLSPNDPDSPLVKYGQRGEIVAQDIRLDPDPNGPNSWNFTYTQRLLLADAPPQDTPMRGSLTFVRGPVPAKYRVPYDPASVIILAYESHEVTTR